MSGLQIDQEVRDRLVEHVTGWGRVNCETGGFLLAGEDERDHMTVLALAGVAGIVRRRDVFSVSSAAIDTLFSWAADEELVVRAQVHSHRGSAFLSKTDLKYGFSVDGFTTSVIPRYVDPSAEPAHWGWWTYGSGAWSRTAAPALTRAELGQVITFDANEVTDA